MFFGNQYIGGFTCGNPKLTRWGKFKEFCKRVFKLTIWTLIGIGILWLAGVTYATLYPVTSYQTIEKVVEIETISPVLNRIAKCESTTGHYNKHGQVAFHANNNGTVDVGKYMINSIWDSKATEMGLDLTVESDNEAFAQYLYKNFGTVHWEASRKCWNK